jgi:DNA-binding transcriptional LysR family regulator
MDRSDSWRVFIAVAGRRSFVGAARALGRSPQAVTRAIAALETRLGTRLLQRTTRAVSLTGDGERCLERARRVVADLDALETPADATRPLAGRLTVTAPALFGRLHVVPLVGELVRRHPGVDVRLLLVDRVVSLAEEAVDVAVRLGDLPDSALHARLLGQVRTVVCASPTYLRRRGVPRFPADLAQHECIAFTGVTPIADRWAFPVAGRRERSQPVHARLVVNLAEAAIDAAAAGLGVVRVLSYQVAPLVAAGQLRVVLDRHEPRPLPVHLVYPPGPQSHTASAFLDLATGRLRPLLT